MRAQLTAIVRRSKEGFVASCAEVPGTEAVSATERDALETLIDAVSIVLEVNRDDAFREAGSDAKRYAIEVGLTAPDDRILEVDAEGYR